MTPRRISLAPNAASSRELRDLISVGPATVRDLNSLGVRSISQLARCNPESLYENLCRKAGVRIDPCCLDVLTAAIAQARNPKLPAQQCVWWYWSRVRKSKASAA
jgi:nucleotidyltransferase/DNA polymerase involved in DNA repair